MALTKADLGNRLRAIRYGHGLDVKTAAKRIGISQRRLQQIERGRDVLSLREGLLAAKAYKVEPRLLAGIKMPVGR